MVDLTVYASAGDFQISDYLLVHSSIGQRTVHGTNVFITDTDIYGATMFAHRGDGKVWDGRLFLGSSAIGGDGEVGFAPQALLIGTVQDESVDNFMSRLADDGLSVPRLEARLLAGADHLTGNVNRDILYGHDSDDVLNGGAGGSDYLSGDSGDDTIIMGGNPGFGSSPFGEAFGGEGDDVIVVAPHIRGYADGGTGHNLVFVPDSATIDPSFDLVGSVHLNGGDLAAGSDTFYLTGKQSRRIGSFDVSDDLLQFDERAFASLGAGVNADNIVIGKGAVPRDDNDFILVAVHRYAASVFYDPDGTGPERKVFVVSLLTSDTVTADNFLVGHLDQPGGQANALRPTVFADTFSPHHPSWPVETAHPLA